MTQLLQNAAYGTVLILAVVILRRVLKDRLLPGARLALWAVCLFRLLTPAAPESALSLWGLSRLFEKPKQAAPAPAPYMMTGYVPAAPAPAPQAGPGISWETVLAALWLVVGVVLAARYVLSWTRTRRAVSCAIPLDRSDGRYAPLPKCARLREGPMEGAPLTFGAVCPTVVLSPGLGGVELDCVLAHEGVHARRRDNLWHYAMALALAVHWWNPAVWFMSRLLRRDIELSCDRAAVRRLGEDRRAEYAQALVTLATQADGPAFCHTFGRKAAEERILSIMKFKKTSIIGAIFSLTLVLAVTAAFASEPKEPQPEYDSEKTHTSVSLDGKAPEDHIILMPDIEATKELQSDYPEVDPDDVDLSKIKEDLAKKVADGKITQEEADLRLTATEEMLEQARRGEVKLFMTDDGCNVYSMGVNRMYYRDENGDLIPMDPTKTTSSYVLDGYVVETPIFEEDGSSVSADGGIIGRMFGDYDMMVDGSHVSGSVIWTSNGAYELCKDKDCDVSYDHCHLDGRVVRVYQKDPGLLCAHPDCDNDKPHQHDGVQYAGKAPEAYVILDPEMDSRFLNDDGSPIITEQDNGPCEPAIPMTLEQYKALLDGLVSKGQMSRKDADDMFSSAQEHMKGQEFPYLWAMESGSYMVTGRPSLCNQSGCHNNGVHAHDGVYYTGCASQDSAASPVPSAAPAPTPAVQPAAFDPDLIPAMGTHGKEGYIRESDTLTGQYERQYGAITNPDEAMKYMEWLSTQPGSYTIPLYDAAGNVIDEFPVGSGALSSSPTSTLSTAHHSESHHSGSHHH